MEPKQKDHPYHVRHMYLPKEPPVSVAGPESQSGFERRARDGGVLDSSGPRRASNPRATETASTSVSRSRPAITLGTEQELGRQTNKRPERFRHIHLPKTAWRSSATPPRLHNMSDGASQAPPAGGIARLRDNSLFTAHLLTSVGVYAEVPARLGRNAGGIVST